jgi:hypothetical protein
MDELLINRVVEKTGLPADRAKAAAESVIGFLKEKLPGPLGGHLDQLLSGGGGSVVDDLKKGLGGLLGK